MPASPLPLSSQTLDRLARAAEEAGPRIQRVEVDDRIFWIKRPGETQAKAWHVLQRVSARLVPHPMLRVTVDRGGPASIQRERERIEAFRDAGFNAPEIVHASSRALVLGDLGDNLGQILKRDRAAFLALLPLVGETLGRVHAAGLTHGRPSRRDLTRVGDAIGFLDFEEDAQASMPLDVAQARDVWLLFIDLARAGLEAAEFEACWSAYRPHLSEPRAAALFGVTRWVARASILVGPIAAPFAGRDLKAPIAAARFLHAARHRP